jgi:hypothetical protein
VDRIVRRLPRSIGGDGGSTRLQHFKLIENVSGASVDGRTCNPDGTGVDSGETPTALVNWSGLLDGALTDYVGLFALIDGEWVFVQGDCVV